MKRERKGAIKEERRKSERPPGRKCRDRAGCDASSRTYGVIYGKAVYMCVLNGSFENYTPFSRHVDADYLDVREALA